MAETIKGINVVIGAETTGLSAALSDVNKKSRSVQTELKAVDRLLKLDPKNTELVAQKQKLLSEAISSTKDKLDTLKTAQAQVNEQFAKGEISEGQYRAFQRELAATEQRLKDLESAAKKSKKSLDEIGDSMQKAGKKISDVGGSLTKGITVPLAAIGGVSVAAAADFESAFAGVRKTVDATEEQFASFKQEIRDMAKEMPQSASEIAAVAEAAGQLGIEVPNIMSFTRTMVDLGVSTNLSAEEAAMSLARLANITQMPQTNFDRLGATVVGLGNNLATTEAEIVAMGLRLAGAGKQVGMTEAQILALGGAMSSVGIQAEAGGTAMSKVMIEIASAVSMGGDYLRDFAGIAGMSSEEFVKAWEDDAAGALVSFIEGLRKFADNGEDIFGVLDYMGLSEIRVRDTLLRAAGAGDLFRESLVLGNQAWEENVALTNEAEQRYGTFESQMKMLLNNLKDIAITLGDVLLPVLLQVVDASKPLIDSIANLAKWFGNLDPTIQKVILAITAILAVIGPVLIVIGKIVTAVGTLIKAFAAVKAAVIAAGGVMAVLTGPVALVIAAVTALAAAAFLIIKNWEPISQFFVDLWNGIVDITSTVWESLKSFFSETWEWLKGFFAEWGTVILAIIAPFLGVPLLIYQHWDTIKEFLSNLWNGIIDYLSGVWENIKSTASNAFQGMVDLVRPIIDGFKTFFSGVWEAIKNIFAGALLLIIDLVTGDFENLRKDAEAIWNNLKKAFGDIWDGIKQIFSGTLQAIETVITTVWTNISNAASKAWNGIKTAISTIVKATVKWIKDEWDAMLRFFRELPEKLYTIGSDMFNRMKDAVSTTVKNVKDTIVNGITEAIDWIKKLPDEMTRLGKNIIDGLVNGIKNSINKVKDTISDVADAVTGGIRNALGIKSPSRVLMELGEWTGEGFALGIADSVDEVKRKTAEMAASAIPAKSEGNTGVTASRSFNFEGMFAGANFIVRNDYDIRRIAEELFSMQQEAIRGAGG